MDESSKKVLRTIDVARRTGIAVNTVRSYEEQGFLPPVPRAENGYRMFTEQHVRHVQLVRQAMHCTWVGGHIRQIALELLKVAAQGDYAAAQTRMMALLDMIQYEQQLADDALNVLDQWVARQYSPSSKGVYRIGEVANRLNITQDELRSWERNGLLTVPRAKNGYRQYGHQQLDRLRVIRTLRRARYSIHAIKHLLDQLDQGQTEDLRQILDSPPPDSEFEAYPTDSWLSTLKKIYEAAQSMSQILENIVTLH